MGYACGEVNEKGPADAPDPRALQSTEAISARVKDQSRSASPGSGEHKVLESRTSLSPPTLTHPPRYRWQQSPPPGRVVTGSVSKADHHVRSSPSRFQEDAEQAPSHSTAVCRLSPQPQLRDPDVACQLDRTNYSLHIMRTPFLKVGRCTIQLRCCRFVGS